MGCRIPLGETVYFAARLQALAKDQNQLIKEYSVTSNPLSSVRQLQQN